MWICGDLVDLVEDEIHDLSLADLVSVHVYLSGDHEWEQQSVLGEHAPGDVAVDVESDVVATDAAGNGNGAAGGWIVLVLADNAAADSAADSVADDDDDDGGAEQHPDPAASSATCSLPFIVSL